MSKYTAVILRPDYIADPHYGEDTYLAHVEADNPTMAAAAGRQQVFAADMRDGVGIQSSADYNVLFVFDGHLDALRVYGWQL